MLELRLMYHYTRTVHAQLPDHDDARTRQMWEITIPQIAFSSEIVLGAILSLSALHLRMLSPEDKDLKYATGHYFGQAVRKYRPALGHIQESTAEPLLVTSIIITYYTWLISYSPTPGVPYQLPLQAFYCLRGVFDLLQELAPYIQSPTLTWLLEPAASIGVGNPPPNRFLSSFNQDMQRFVKTLNHNTTPEDKAVYKCGVEYLGLICNAIASGVSAAQVRRKISYFVARQPRRFTELLGMKDPRAMAILARNLALIHVVPYAWWLHGPPGLNLEEYHVRGFSELIPVEWLWVMDWPLRVVSGRLTLDGNGLPSPITPPQLTPPPPSPNETPEMTLRSVQLRPREVP